MNSTIFEIEPLTKAVIPFGLHLKSMAGWNQLATDWEVLLSMSNGGSYLAIWQGIPAGTVTTVQYEEQFSWIGMVLVDPQFRGLGIGTRLLRAAIEFGRLSGPVLLDATPKGRKLYLKLGFVDICPIERLEIDQLRINASFPDLEIRPIREDLLPQLIAFDAPHFGARRDKLLRSYWKAAPEYAFAAFTDDQISGYCLGRHGSHFEQIGPIVARDETTAHALLATAAQNTRSLPVIMDILPEQQSWRAFLLDLGFSVQRPFTRMSLGDWKAQTDRSGQFAIAGPEFG